MGVRAPPLAVWIQHLRRDIEAALVTPGGSGAASARGSGGRVTLEFAVTAEVDEQGGLVVRPVTDWSRNGAGGPVPHRVTVEFELGRAGERVESGGQGKAVTASVASEEQVVGGDRATLRRRLELILGGPPGFTTGAKAEILADLLREFGRATLIEEIHREWGRHFDTGADPSPSVSQS